jgi:hypothetical protein
MVGMVGIVQIFSVKHRDMGVRVVQKGGHSQRRGVRKDR